MCLSCETLIVELNYDCIQIIDERHHQIHLQPGVSPPLRFQYSNAWSGRWKARRSNLGMFKVGTSSSTGGRVSNYDHISLGIKNSRKSRRHRRNQPFRRNIQYSSTATSSYAINRDFFYKSLWWWIRLQIQIVPRKYELFINEIHLLYLNFTEAEICVTLFFNRI